jgi:cytosine/adenosine deaminase-related metal-dependent hydrolase
VWLFGKQVKQPAGTVICLRGGLCWIDEKLVVADVLLEGGQIRAIGNPTAPEGTQEVDLKGRLVTPGLIDLDRNLIFDAVPVESPGPYLDRADRWAEIGFPDDPGPDEIETAIYAILKEGVTTAAGPKLVDTGGRLRVASGPWVNSLLLERNPGAGLNRSRGGPVWVRVGDGDSKASRREFDLLVEHGLLAPNVLAVGGVGLKPSQAAKLADVGAALVWRPITDQFILGQTVSAEVLATPDLRVVLGGGARREGGRGLGAALQRADALGYMDRTSLIRSVTTGAAAALQVDRGRLAEGLAADLVIWNAPDIETALFDPSSGRASAVLVGGSWKVGGPECFT